MNNRETVLKLAEAFNKGDVDTILDNFSEDGEWQMLGDKTYSGKETIKQMFAAHLDMKVISCTFDHVIAEGDTVAIDGFVQCVGKDGGQMNMYYCDIYELENGKVKKMISYTVDKKS